MEPTGPTLDSLAPDALYAVLSYVRDARALASLAAATRTMRAALAGTSCPNPKP